MPPGLIIINILTIGLRAVRKRERGDNGQGELSNLNVLVPGERNREGPITK